MLLLLLLLLLLCDCCCPPLLQEPYMIPDTVPSMMRRVDADGDGSMAYEEFRGLLQVRHCWFTSLQVVPVFRAPCYAIERIYTDPGNQV
jgi:hypothetical protein